MDDLKTVEGSLDPIYQQQKEGVSKMRTSLLACTSNPSLAKTAINQVTVLRIYHQIARIIKYLEMMDKLEEKMYEAIDHTIDNANTNSPSGWMMLMGIQERLQKTMIESHKLLQPYMELKDLNIMDLMEAQQNDESSPTKIILDAESRDKLRNNAQAVLLELGEGGSYEPVE